MSSSGRSPTGRSSSTCPATPQPVYRVGVRPERTVPRSPPTSGAGDPVGHQDRQGGAAARCREALPVQHRPGGRLRRRPRPRVQRRRTVPRLRRPDRGLATRSARSTRPRSSCSIGRRASRSGSSVPRKTSRASSGAFGSILRDSSSPFPEARGGATSGSSSPTRPTSSSSSSSPTTARGLDLHPRRPPARHRPLRQPGPHLPDAAEAGVTPRSFGVFASIWAIPMAWLGAAHQ